MPAEFTPGFAAYLAAIFIPGLGLGELVGLWRQGSTLAERLALCLGLGLVVDTIWMATQTDAISLIIPSAGRIDVITVYSEIFVGALFLVASLVRRRQLLFPVKPGKVDLALLALLLTQSLMVLLYLEKFPIFPEFQSGDYSQHVRYVQQLVAGYKPSGFEGLLYYGVEYQLASGLALVGGQGLITVRYTMSILVILSPLLFYLASNSLFENSSAALASSLIYSVSATIWFVSVFNSGLYANFFGVLISLLFVEAVCRLLREKTPKMWLFFFVTLFTAYFSHYTTLTIFPSVLIVALVVYRKAKNHAVTYIAPAVISLAPILAAVIVFPTLLGTLLRYVVNGGGAVYGSTFLSKQLPYIPVLRYLAAEVQNDWGTVLMLGLCICFGYAVLRSKNGIFLLPLLWFLSILVVAPFNVGAWRFSFEALVPLTLMSGYGLYILFGWITARLGKVKVIMTRPLKVVLVILLLTPLLYGSWGHTILTDSLSSTSSNATAQREIYTAINWLDNNTPRNSTYLSVTDWKLTYTNLIIDRPTFYKYFSDQNQTIQYANEIGAQYVIVTRITSLNLPQLPQYHPWDSFQNESGFTQIYSSADIRIYQLQ